MDFQIPIYRIEQISCLYKNDANAPALECIKLSFSSEIELSESNFGIQVDSNSFQPEFHSGDILIFSKKESDKALQNIYLFITDDSEPLIGEIINTQEKVTNLSTKQGQSSSNKYRIARRKSFMTPTPLHIPTSQISPVADSSHERILIRPIGGEKQFISILWQKTINSFPMVFIQKN
jgi:hypothetical protein